MKGAVGVCVLPVGEEGEILAPVKVGVAEEVEAAFVPPCRDIEEGDEVGTGGGGFEEEGKGGNEKDGTEEAGTEGVEAGDLSGGGDVEEGDDGEEVAEADVHVGGDGDQEEEEDWDG